MNKIPQTVKILVENESELGPVFRIDEQRVKDALTAFPDLADRIEITFSTDCDRFDAEIGSAHVLIGWRFPHQTLKKAALQLRWVHLTGAGVEHLAPFDWIPPGVIVTNNRGVHASKVEEFGIMAALMLATRMPQLFHAQREHRWEQIFSKSVVGQTVGIVGVGNMGGAVATGCKKLGMHTLGIRRSGGTHSAIDAMLPLQDLNRLLGESDIVFLSTPLTSETKGLMGTQQFAAMKRGAGIVNIARGGVIDAPSLMAALKAGHLSGAILDVFDLEPLPSGSPLWDMPNVVITPHCSSDDAEHYVPMTLQRVFTNVRNLVTGQPLFGVVDPLTGY